MPYFKLFPESWVALRPVEATSKARQHALLVDEGSLRTLAVPFEDLYLRLCHAPRETDGVLFERNPLLADRALLQLVLRR